MSSRHTKIGYHEAAERRTVTITGWVCLGCNRLFPDDGKGNGIDVGPGQAERLARYCCSRESLCSERACNAVAQAPWACCAKHREEREAAERAKAKRAPWDGEAMLCLDDGDHFYVEPDEVEEALAGEGVTIEEAVAEGRVILCRPNRAREFDLSSHVGDELPEDNDDLLDSPELLAAISALNKALEALPPLSWSPSSTRWDGTVKAKAASP